ncbi:MAG: class I SAM-dependent methyltransferase [Planctomycetota bacterium]
MVRSLYSNEQFTLVRCRQCSLIYVNPRQAETAKYDQLLHGGAVSTYEKGQERDRQSFQSILENLEQIAPPGHLLDVGCATGGLLRAARERGWKTTGVEINRDTAAFATREHHLDVHHGTLDELQLPENSFDAVTLINVIEHLYRPSSTLREVYRVLHPGGRLVCLTPDFNHYAIRLAQTVGFLRDADRIDPTGHPYHFTPRTLARLINNQGFQIAHCRSPISGHNILANRSFLWPFIAASRLISIGSTIQCLAIKPLKA